MNHMTNADIELSTVVPAVASDAIAVPSEVSKGMSTMF